MDLNDFLHLSSDPLVNRQEKFFSRRIVIALRRPTLTHNEWLANKTGCPDERWRCGDAQFQTPSFEILLRIA